MTVPKGTLRRLIACCIPDLSMVVGTPWARGGHCTTACLLGGLECHQSVATSQSKVSAKPRALLTPAMNGLHIHSDVGVFLQIVHAPCV